MDITLNTTIGNRLTDSAVKLLGMTPYLSCRAHIVEILDRLGSPPMELNHQLLTEHLLDGRDGLAEYKLEQAKRDEVAGHVQRYSSDSVVPSIVSTYAGLRLLQLTSIEIDDATRAAVVASCERFFKSQDSTGVGFGAAISIAKYSKRLGPSGTLLETARVLAAPELVSGVLS
jgi:hypothetical protein